MKINNDKKSDKMTCFKLLKKIWLLCNSEFKESFREENRRLWKLRCDERNKLIKLENCINGLMKESKGVVGLHLNGEIADWDWLINNDWLPADIKLDKHIKKDIMINCLT